MYFCKHTIEKKMECLHGVPASSSKTTNGVFFYCGQKPSCNFFCPQNDCSYFHNAITMWRNSNTPQPKCHEHKELTKMLVVKDIFKPSFGGPFFVCSDKEKPCSFWKWGDVIRPQCYMACNVQRERSRKRALIMVVYFIPVRKVKTIRAAILSGEIKKKTKTRSSHFSLCILATLLCTGIRLRRLAKISQVVMRIASKLTKKTCPLKQRKRTCKTGYANYV